MRACLDYGQQHPDVTGYQLWALWSLNERLAGREGVDLPHPSSSYLTDLLAAREMDLEATENPTA